MAESTEWYSARLRHACLFARGGQSDYMDRVFVFQSRDFREAVTRAIELGYAREESLTNGDGEEVRWRFKEVISLDVIEADELDGAEVYSERVVLADDQGAFDAVYRPEASQPTRTI